MKSILVNKSATEKEQQLGTINNLFKDSLSKEALKQIKGGTNGGEDDNGEEDAIMDFD